MSIKDKIEKHTELFERYCTNNYSREDLETLYTWFEKPGYDLIRRNAMSKYWSQLETKEISKEDIDSELLLDKIHHLINLNAKQYGLDVISGSKKILHMNSVIKVFYKVAAVLIIPLLIVSLSYFLQDERFFPSKQDLFTETYLPGESDERILQSENVTYSEIYSPLGSKIKIDLSDGSEVWLNHGSKLKYPQKFGKDSREVFLSGEAYFNVNEDPARPFIVKTSVLYVKVVGTSFNLSAYPDDNTIMTTLDEGKIIIFKALKDGSSEKITELEPRQQGVFNVNSKKLTVQTVKTVKYTSWKEGKLLLLDDPMDIVISKLERWYNVDIELADPNLKGYRYTATFIDETLPQVLQLLSLATPIEFHFTSRIKQQNNTYSKSKVIISRKTNE